MSIKKISLIALAILPMTVFAAYSAKIPLEVLNGGSLPDGSIVIGDNESSGPTEPTSSTCYFNGDRGDMVMVINPGYNIGPFSEGDVVYNYRGIVIGYKAGSDTNIPSGLSMGALMDTLSYGSYHQICSDNIESYPEVNLPVTEGPTEPTESTEDPRIQACRDKEPQVVFILNTYGLTLDELDPYIDVGEDVMHCTAAYEIPPEPDASSVKSELEAIDVETAE